jgi:tripartite-type tricarboxylate transporter receptor subunit TctC
MQDLATRRRFVLRLTAAACGAAGAIPARARPVTELIVPYPAGGFTDAMSRSVADALAQQAGLAVIVVNRPGANSVVALRQVIAQGATDGSTIVLGSLGYLTSRWKASGAPFDPKALAPVVFAGSTPSVLYIRADIPARTTAEFIAWGRAQPQAVAFGTSGPASSPHLNAESFCALTGLKMPHVPFAGSPATLTALGGGQIDATFDSVASRQMVASGRVRALMQGESRRLAQWPELPTPGEAGLGDARFGSWFGYFVPAGTPVAVQEKLNADFNAALAAPAVRTRFEQLCLVRSGGSREDFDRFLQAEAERLGQLIATRHIHVD